MAAKTCAERNVTAAATVPGVRRVTIAPRARSKGAGAVGSEHHRGPHVPEKARVGGGVLGRTIAHRHTRANHKII